MDSGEGDENFGSENIDLETTFDMLHGGDVYWQGPATDLVHFQLLLAMF
jgi:hypothetical protein